MDLDPSSPQAPRKPLSAPPKPLTGELGDSTVADLKKFKESVIASKQFADDHGSRS
jgi:hypothetical protein